MPETKWPDSRRLIGTKIPRLDGPGKSTGTARYGQDFNRKGMLHALVLRSPHARCKITKLDLAAASKMPGVKAIVTAGQVLYRPKKGEEAGWNQPISRTDVGRTLFYQGDEILAIAADTEEHAQDALRAVVIEYEQMAFFVKEADVLKNQKAPSTVPGNDETNMLTGNNRKQGDIAKGFQAAEATVEQTYGVAVQTHVCLETHGTVAEWTGTKLTLWCSTQAVPGTADAMVKYFPVHGVECQCECITHVMGGGYGSKFGPDVQGQMAAVLALLAKAPVKLFLDRAEEHLAGGNRPSADAKVKIGGKKDGTVTAFEAASYGTPGIGRAAGVNATIMPYVYEVANVLCTSDVIRLNHGGARAMRAPSHPQNCLVTEAAFDDFANTIGMDPMQVRLKNLPQNNPKIAAKDPRAKEAVINTIYTSELKKIAEMCNWSKLWHPPGKGPRKGPVKHGVGLALHTWGGLGRGPNDVFVTIRSDGSVLAECSTQDLGTGQRTLLAIISAEVLGLEVKDITVVIGESRIGRSTASGGSTTCPGTSPACLNAAADARDQFLAKIAPKLGAKPEDLVIEKGQITDKSAKKSWPWRQACARLGMESVRGSGNWSAGLSSSGVGGVQAAEVWVDTETGVVRCSNIWAVQDCGLVINKLGCESQVAGGVIMGVNYALFEEMIVDRHTGRMVNPDMEFYKLGGLQDMPEIHVHMHDMPERGVIGIGEPPTIGTAAAIGNAVCNAIGVRVTHAPFTPQRVLAAIRKGGAK
jgi:xanthine dehydrogenase YagR molybdenum-binding subunit